MRAHDTPVAVHGHLGGLDGLGDAADLVHLKEEGVARLLLEAGGDARRVGHQEIVSDNLAVHLGSHLGVSLPVVLVERILDGHHREVLAEALVHVHELIRGEVVLGLGGLVLEVKIVLLVLAELRGCNVHADLDLAGEASHLDGLDQELEALVVGLDVRGEAALVTHVARVLAVLLLDDLLEGVVHLAAHLHGLLEGLGADRADHELLHGKAVAGVGAAVDDVHPGHRKADLLGAGEVGDVLVEGHTLLGSAGLAARERDREDRVGAELGFVGGAVELDHLVVDGLLLNRVHAGERRADDRLHVLDSLENALAEVALVIAIPELAGLVDASGGTGRHSAAEGADIGGEVDLDGGVTTGVDDLAGSDGLDGHCCV
mmetsp:Transcript_59688/g.140563  ORF Transcript_59688/g.140563 Transcript_59688/m.140563 type:complete len:374 (-) Transcript_59688:7-1128(-)